MKTLALAVAATVALAAAPALSRAAAKTLDIYVIDVEGGQSTLIATPARESVLIDTGFPSDGTFNSTPGTPATARDAQRILAAGRAAGLTRIDYLLTTHYHADHDGCATAARRTKRPGGGRPASDNGGSVTPQTPLMLPIVCPSFQS